jgi:FKBP-type peptidyl-prolyl cis-trans isomerase
VLLLGTFTTLSAADSAPAVPIPAVAPAKKYSEAEILEFLGWFLGTRTGIAPFEFNDAEMATITKGFATAASGKESPIKPDEIGEQFSAYMDTRQKAAMEKQTAKQEKFLTDKKAQPGVTALPSGLLYEVVKSGSGAFPKATDTVKVNYTGTLIDGTVFDATSKHSPPEPSEFALNQVIPGWTEGIQKINKGGKLKLYIPAKLAYGDNPPPGSPILPGSTLVFEVELLDLK